MPDSGLIWRFGQPDRNWSTILHVLASLMLYTGSKIELNKMKIIRLINEFSLTLVSLATPNLVKRVLTKFELRWASEAYVPVVKFLDFLQKLKLSFE